VSLPELSASRFNSGLRHPSSWSLTTKLVTSVVGLFLIVTVATSALTAVLMHDYLLNQLDRDVLASTLRTSGRPGGGPGGPGGGPPGGGGSSLLLVLRDGTPARNVVVTETEFTELTAGQVSTLNSAGLGRQPRSIDLGGALGDFRVAAVSTPTGETVITGQPLSAVNEAVGQVVSLVAGGTIVGLVCVAAGGTWLVRKNLEPLRRVAGTASRVSRLKLDSGDVAVAERVPAADTDPRTEVGQVGQALNSLLDNVEGALQARHESETRVRQFVADASHELRTPLASIRGYAELSRRVAEPVPAAVAQAMGRVESEALRMQALVEDLLLLARLDAGRPLARERVDLSLLAVDVVSGAHAASPDHRWKLSLPDEPIEAVGDAHRLHQVLANLLANARTHTPAGTTVTTSLHPDGTWVRISVHDDGPGVPDALQRNVFQRFTRGDDSRAHGAGSTGLGLSIVDAVTQAHGGRVEVTSSPGDTTFSVLLPAS
jgi:two-component system OmpR family sensor kinase